MRSEWIILQKHMQQRWLDCRKRSSKLIRERWDEFGCIAAIRFASRKKEAEGEPLLVVAFLGNGMQDCRLA
jgi:hypothetical protein